MCYDYWRATGSNPEFLREFLPKMSTEAPIASLYSASSSFPRPESFFEDVKHNGGDWDAAKYFNNIRAAAASGWDFSSRWCGGLCGENLTKIRAAKTIPVDLNA